MGFDAPQTNRKIQYFSIDSSNKFNNFFNEVQGVLHGENWPVVYLLHNDNPNPHKLLYIGETTSAVRRMKEHFTPTNSNFSERKQLDVAHFIFDDTFNKSAILDINGVLSYYPNRVFRLWQTFWDNPVFF